MRDPKRINKFCNQLAAAWSTLPDMRFAQLMDNIFAKTRHEGRDPFFLEDDEMIEKIKSFCEGAPMIKPYCEEPELNPIQESMWDEDVKIK